MKHVDPEAIRAGERSALARALNLLESSRRDHADRARALVDALAPTPRPGAHVVGLTGPPGVGKSTLAGELTRRWRAADKTVGVLAADPSSRRSGGALLGDRARMAHTDGDPGVFIRSMAAREQLGGLAPATADAALILRAGCDRVLVETVGVGQSETDVALVADTVVVIVQPASGDTLQFLKAGIMEVPDLLVVNKGDLGAAARRARSDLLSALGTLGVADDVGVLVTSCDTGEGLDALVEALEARRRELEPRLASLRRDHLRRQCVERFRELYGALALDRLGGRSGAARLLEAEPAGAAPGSLLAALVARA